MATVAVHKCLSANVADFKSKYHDWSERVPTILKKMKKKKRRLTNIAPKGDKEDIKTLNKESKASKIKSDTELLESEEEKDSEGVSELSGEESEQSTYNEHNENVQSSESEIDEKEDSHNELSSEEKSDLDENHEHVKSKSNKRIKNIRCKNENKPSIKNIASEKDCKISNTSKNVESCKENKINKTIIQKVVDPFFVTSTNEEYVSSQVPSVVDGHSDWRPRNTNFESREYKSFDKNNRKWGAKEYNSKHNKFSKFNNQPYKKPTFNHFDKGPVHNNFKTTNKLIIGNRKARRSVLHHPVQEEKLEKLHPSWEAKKKLSSIASFKGKKITFD